MRDNLLEWRIRIPEAKPRFTATVNITASDLLHACWDWDAVCDEIGLNPWAINEGLIDGDHVLTITLDQAKRFGLNP